MIIAYRYVVVAASGEASSFSHGFFRLERVADEAWPVRSVLGISLMPGMGSPVVISSTMCAKDVGYGAGGSLALAGASGRMPPALLVVEPAGEAFTPLGAGRPRALR